MTAYLAPPGLEAEVRRELGDVIYQLGSLLLAPGPPRSSIWAQDIWLDCHHESVASISAAANLLRAVQTSWAPLSLVEHRRLALIADKLRPVRERAWTFPTKIPSTRLGSFTLLNRTTLLYSATRSSPFRHGEIRFLEDHGGPPSRAYRKLWELFTLLGVMPSRGSRCIDMGASPGGWTWVLARLGANVRSVDKAAMDPAVAGLANVRTMTVSAFSLEPREVKTPYDWFFSDVICEPRRLLRMVRRWQEAGAAARFVCTLKFKGETDHETIEGFRAIPGSRLLHLHHNRHELTWVCLAPEDRPRDFSLSAAGPSGQP